MRSFILVAATAASLFSGGCLVGVRGRPVAHYHRAGPPPAVYVAPGPRYYEHRDHYYYRDDRGYRTRYYR